MRFVAGDRKKSIEIMREAALRLIEKNIQLWSVEDLNEENLFKGLDDENIIVGYVGNEPAVTMILTWHDPLFWPNVAPNTSGFIHKLSVGSRFTGKDIAKEMIEYGAKQCKNRNMKFLRLDCAADREKLCGFYEGLGFKKVDRRYVGSYDIAFYEMTI